MLISRFKFATAIICSDFVLVGSKLLDSESRDEKKNDHGTPSISDKNQGRKSSIAVESMRKDEEAKVTSNTEAEKNNSNLWLAKNVCSVSFTPDSSPAKDLDASKETDDVERYEERAMEICKVDCVDKEKEVEKKKRQKKLLSKNQVLILNIDENGLDRQMINYNEVIGE